MPGVIITTATRTGPVTAPAPESGRYFVVGQFARGPVTARLVRDFAEFTRVYGERPAYSHAWDSVRTYFEEGGSEAVIVRVAGTAATTGTVTLKDTAGVDTLRVDAAAPGAWSGGIDVVVATGSTAGTVSVSVWDAAGTVLLERRDNLTSPAGAASAFQASQYIRVTDLGSVTVAPGNNPVAGRFRMSAGVDDLASITAATMSGALTRLGSEWGTGAVAIPGYSAEQVGDALAAHARERRRLALTATVKGATEEDVTATADRLINANGEYIGLFYPWVAVPSPTGGTMLTPPEGFVAAARARAHREDGPWRAPAGDISVARYVVDVERQITREEGDRLDEAHVNAIRTINRKVCLYGWRSLSNDVANYSLLNGRDVLNTVAILAERALEPFVFRTIDARGHLISEIENALIGIVEPIAQEDGLYPRVIDGELIDPGYSITVTAPAVDPASGQTDHIDAVIALRVSPVGVLINLTIIKAGLYASV